MHVRNRRVAVTLVEANLCQVSQVDHGEEEPQVLAEVEVQSHGQENSKPASAVTAAGGASRSQHASGKSVQSQRPAAGLFVPPTADRLRVLLEGRGNVLRLLGGGEGRYQGQILLHRFRQGKAEVEVFGQREELCDQAVILPGLVRLPCIVDVVDDVDELRSVGSRDIRKTETP